VNYLRKSVSYQRTELWYRYRKKSTYENRTNLNLGYEIERLSAEIDSGYSTVIL
jgi:hypothetical protein